MNRFLAGVDDEKLLDLLAGISMELHEERGDRTELLREQEQLMIEFRRRKLPGLSADGQEKRNGA